MWWEAIGHVAPVKPPLSRTLQSTWTDISWRCSSYIFNSWLWYSQLTPVVPWRSAVSFQADHREIFWTHAWIWYDRSAVCFILVFLVWASSSSGIKASIKRYTLQQIDHIEWGKEINLDIINLLMKQGRSGNLLIENRLLPPWKGQTKVTLARDWDMP